MAKKAYVGVSNVARKVKKMYVGINGVARKVKKGYIGVNGVARLFFTSVGEVIRRGSTTLSQPQYETCATGVGDYALFALGDNGSPVGIIDAFNSALTRTTPTQYVYLWSAGAAALPSYGLIAFGSYSDGERVRTYRAYTSQLTVTTSSFASGSRSSPASASTGDYAIFCGGSISSYSTDTINIINNSLTENTSHGFRYPTDSHSILGISFGNYAIFVSGKTTGIIISSTLTKSTPTLLEDAYFPEFAATTVGNYAIIGSCESMNSSWNKVQVLNSSLTAQYAPSFITGRGWYGAASLGNFAIFAGGKRANPSGNYDYVYLNSTEIYDSSLTVSTGPTLATSRYYITGVTVGSNAFMGGGQTFNADGHYSSVYFNTVDVFKVD